MSGTWSGPPRWCTPCGPRSPCRPGRTTPSAARDISPCPGTYPSTPQPPTSQPGGLRQSFHQTVRYRYLFLCTMQWPTASLDTCSKCGNQFMIVVCRNLRFLNNFPEISSKRSTSWNKFINVNTWSNATSANTPEILFLWLLKAKVYLSIS